MITPVTFAYTTCRKHPRIEWFFDALKWQSQDEYPWLPIVVVDYYADQPGRREIFEALAGRKITHVLPKPNIWQGKYRKTPVDFSALSTAKNTAACYVKTKWVAFIDDLSVPMPGWFQALQRITEGDAIGCSAYFHVRDLVVHNGVPVTWDDNFKGIEKDCRWNDSTDGKPVPIAGNGMYGFPVIPIEALLSINGYDEDLDIVGIEDCTAGVYMEKAGYKFVYDKRMMHLEREEDHQKSPRLKCCTTKTSKVKGKNSHEYFCQLLSEGRSSSINNEYNLRDLRNTIINGGSFPTEFKTTHYWSNGTPIKEMHNES